MTADELRGLGYEVRQANGIARVLGHDREWVVPNTPESFDAIAAYDSFWDADMDKAPQPLTSAQIQNEVTLLDRARQAVDVLEQAITEWQAPADTALTNLESADTNWATLTAAQKDGATRLAVRVSALLGRKDPTAKLTVRVALALVRLTVRRLEAA